MVGGVPDPGQRRRWTYAELLAEAEQAARALTARFAPGERVAVWAPNLPEWVILEYAAGLAGLVLVTVNPALRPAELAYVLNQCRSATWRPLQHRVRHDRMLPAGHPGQAG